MADFVIIGCHANRASEASVTLRHLPTGAVVSVHHVPFEHDYGETAAAECERIQSTAAEIASGAAEFMADPPEAGSVNREARVGSPTGHTRSRHHH